jgi:subtilisin family serine protease
MKKITSLFLLFFILFVFLYGAPLKKQNDFSKKGDKIVSPISKLIGPLKEAIEIYKTDSKLSEKSISKYYLKKRSSVGLPFSSPKFTTLRKRKQYKTRVTKIVNTKTGKIIKIESKQKMKPILIEALIDENIQKRWGNPPYDVLNCDIEVSGDILFLNNFNLKIRSVSEYNGKKIVNVEIPSIELEKLTYSNKVLRISPVLKKTLLNDKACFFSGAARIRLKENGLWSKGYTGKNVIVGIIDTGIDWTHEDFINPSTGKTRILYLWDTKHTTVGKTPADVFGGALSTLNTGTLWTKDDIDTGACTETDTDGHGTHVSGTATGNGHATGKYTGMAPNADIIAVKGLDNNGILFIYELSKRLGKACSVNMSYGPGLPFVYISLWPQYYPADGTSTNAQKIAGWNSSYGRGHIPVKAAGNEGHWNTYTDLTGGKYPYMNGAYHIEGRDITSSNSHTISVYNYKNYWNSNGWGNPNYNDYAIIQFGMWYESPVKITVIPPSGKPVSFQHGENGSISNTNGKIVYNLNNTPASNGAYYGTFHIQYYSDPASQPTPGDWQLIVEPLGSSANYDIWISNIDVFLGNKYLLQQLSYFTQNYSHSNYIIDEGASPYEITVGSWTTRDRWTDGQTGWQTYSRKPWIGAISQFSSPGPSRDRRVKPDIAAPGEIIISSASKDASADPVSYVGDEHITMSGTSMATPVVTGGIALIQEKLGGKSVPQIRNIIINWARHDLHTRHFSQKAFGYGKFDVISLNEQPVAVISQNKDEIILDNSDKTVSFNGNNSSDYEKFPLTYKWNIEEKPQGASPSFTANGSSAKLTVDPNVEGKYRVSLIVNDTIVDSEKVLSREIIAKFYPVLPPSNFTLKRIENNLGFTKEYINKLKWEINPKNKVEIAKYKLYRKRKGENDSSYKLIKEFSSSVFNYDDKGLTNSDLFVYKLTAVCNKGKESDPVIVSN